MKKLHHCLKNKKVWLFLVLLFIPLLVFPVYNAKAALWEVFTAIPSGMITLLLQMILLLSEAVLSFANVLLKWSLGGGIFAYSATNPAANPIINIGWTLLRDITNTMFIIGLAYIGLMTVLDLTKFQTKQTFIKLIIIALFINFSPVACGLIVDVSNLLGGLFLRGIDFSELVDVFSTQRGILWEHTFSLFANGSILLQVLMLIFYGIVAGGILLLYAALFFIRFPALWILVILSPLMFFFWIFDQTRKWFNSWWGQFLQWAFIIVPSGFFIYLSQHALILSKDMLNKASEQPEELSAGVFSNISAYFVAVIFLIFGLIMAMKINAKGAGAVMSFAKKAAEKGKKTAAHAAKKVAGKTAKAPAEGAKWAARKIRNRLKTRQEEVPAIGSKEWKEWSKKHKTKAWMKRAGRIAFGGGSPEERRVAIEEAGKGTKVAARITGIVLGGRVAGAIGRRVKHKVAKKLQTDQDKKVEEKAKKVMELKDPELQLAAFQDAITADAKVGAMLAIKRSGNYGILKDKMGEQERKKVIQMALNNNMGEAVSSFKTLPEFVEAYRDEKMTRKMTKEEKESEKQVIESQIQKNKDRDSSLTKNIKSAEENLLKLATEEKELEKKFEILKKEKDDLEDLLKVRGYKNLYPKKVQELEDKKKDLVEIGKKREETVSKIIDETSNLQSTKSEQEALEKQNKDLEQKKKDIEDDKVRKQTLSESAEKRYYTFMSPEDNIKFQGTKVVEFNDAGEIKTDPKTGEAIVKILDPLEAKIKSLLTPSQIGDFSKKEAGEYLASEIAHKFGTQGTVSKALEVGGKPAIDILTKSIPAITGTEDPAKQEEFYAKNAPQMLNYLKSTAARTLGVSFGIEQSNLTLSSLEKRLIDINDQLTQLNASSKAQGINAQQKQQIQETMDGLGQQKKIIEEKADEIKKKKKS